MKTHKRDPVEPPPTGPRGMLPNTIETAAAAAGSDFFTLSCAMDALAKAGLPPQAGASREEFTAWYRRLFEATYRQLSGPQTLDEIPDESPIH